MVKIRKETSNRKKSNDRAKLRKKVRDGRKKNKKAAKKDVQWKSKIKKDPGIPNEFPYKDQILAEVAEQRRLAVEEKERKKEDKQRALAKARAIARGEPVDESDEEDLVDEEDAGDEEEPLKEKRNLNVGADSIASLSAKLVTAQLLPRPKPAAEVEEEDDEDEDEVPVLINRDLPNLKSVLDKADVVLEILDGRNPLAFRSQHIEDLATEMGKKVVLVLNKIDTCPREAVVSWSQYLRSQRPTMLFKSATSFLPEMSTPKTLPAKKGKGKGKAKVPVDDAVGAETLLACLAQWAKEKTGDGQLVVAVVGVTNVGKSAFINSLLRRAALPVYSLASSFRGPTTTELPQEVTLDIEDQKITLIDTPGLSFTSIEDDDGPVHEERRARDILLRSKGRIDRLKDPNPPIVHIVSRANAEDLMLLYSLPAFAKGDPTAFLSGVARAHQLVKKKGDLDLTGAARIVLRDWSVGKLSHYTTPPTSTSTLSATPVPAEPSSKTQLTENGNEDFIAQLYSRDDAILAVLPTRKEKRKQGGLVKLLSGVVDDRKAAVEDDWAGQEDSEDEESNDGEQLEHDVEGMDVDEEEEEEEEAEEEGSEEEDEDEDDEPTPPPISNKQKRKRVPEASAPEPPSKKVAFAPPASKHSKREPKHAPVNPAQQKPLKSAQAPSKKPDIKPKVKPVSASTVNVPKVKTGPMKASAAPKNVSDNKAKVANVSTNKTKRSKDGNEPEAYDFGKFF